MTSLNQTEYLKLSTDEWLKSLDNSFEYLRSSWEKNWIGLPSIFKSCTESLINIEKTSDPRVRPLLDAGMFVAKKIEEQDYSAWEPNYHNRLHFADALTSMTFLLAIEKERSGKLLDYWTALLLLTVTAHDFLHPGGMNRSDFEIELKTIEELNAIWTQSPIDSDSKKMLAYMIKHTDPKVVHENHQLIKNIPFEFNTLWATVLVNEVDILASCTKMYGPKLSQHLAEEWKYKKNAAHEIVATEEGRINFLKSIKFSSPASKILGIEKEILDQI